MKCPKWLLDALEKGEGVMCTVDEGDRETLISGFAVNEERYPFFSGEGFMWHCNAQPLPPWSPEVGDVVFYAEGDEILVARVIGVDYDEVSGLDVTIITTTGYTIHCWVHEVKKFDPVKVGLAWEEI